MGGVEVMGERQRGGARAQWVVVRGKGAGRQHRSAGLKFHGACPEGAVS